MARQVAGPQVEAHGWLLVPHNRRQYLFQLHTAGPGGPLYLYKLPAGTSVEDETFRLYQGGGGAERTYEAEITQGGGVVCSCPGYGHRRTCWHAEYLGHLSRVWGHVAPLIAQPPTGAVYTCGMAALVTLVGEVVGHNPAPVQAPEVSTPAPVQAPNVSQVQSTLDDLLGGF